MLHMGLFRSLKRAGEIAKIGIAARKVRKADTPAAESAAKRALALLLSDARGIPMKIGQLLAGSSPEFEQLTESIDPEPLSTMQLVIEASLGRPLSEIFTQLEESSAAASLGQVHRGVLLDGSEVAVKVQYPGIADAVSTELKLAGLMPGVGPAKKWDFDIDGYRRVLARNMRAELDYRSEAARQESFRVRVKVPGLIVPKVRHDLTSSGVLVQSWQSGSTMKEAMGWAPVIRKRVAEVLLQTLFKSIFEHGEVHGDPHAGNYRFHEEGVILFDFGCTLTIPQPARLALLGLIMAAADGREINYLESFRLMGFDKRKLAQIRDRLPSLCAALFQPFARSKPFDAKNWKLGEKVREQLGELRWWFRSAGPPELFLLMRAFQGTVLQLNALDIQLNWHKILGQTLDVKLLEQAQTLELQSSADLPTVPVSNLLLRITIDGPNGRELAMSMPAEEALRLEEIMPESAKEACAKAGINVGELVNTLAADGIVKCQLLNAKVDGKAVVISIE